MGKSRLLADARARRDGGSGFRWTWTENVSYGRTEPYRYIRQFAQALADEHGVDSGTFTRRLLFTDDIGPGDRPPLRRGDRGHRPRRLVLRLGGRGHRTCPTTRPRSRRTLIDLADRYLERLLTTTGPRVVVIDDLHWQDPSSVADDRPARRGHPALPARRPGRHPARATLPRWVDRPDVIRLDLAGLDAPDTAHLATLVARAAVDADGARSLHERTGGNPLFVSETVRAFLEDGTMELRDGRVALVDPSSTRVPDHPAGGPRRAHRRARSGRARRRRRRLGHRHPVPRGCSWPASSTGRVDRASWPGWPQEAIVQPVDGGDWRFAHPLIHDAAYAGLLASHRRVLHARLADQLEDARRAAGHRAAGRPSGRGRRRRARRAAPARRPPSAP